MQEWPQESRGPRVRVMALGVIIDLERRSDSREGEGLVLYERPPPVREAERIVVAEVYLGRAPINHGLIRPLHLRLQTGKRAHSINDDC